MPADLAPGGSVGDLWFALDDVSAIPRARREVATLAQRLGFSEARTGEAQIVVSELASNVVKHARGGDLAIGVVGQGPAALLRVVAIDSGPGSRDIEALVADGVSTSGTLGIGLGAARRLATHLALYSVPAVGTIAEAQFAGSSDGGAIDVASLTRPLGGTGPCGDSVAFRDLPDGRLVLLADGLGHGPLAAAASTRAVEVFQSSASTAPGTLLTEINRALGSTRGAAVAVVRLEAEAGRIVHASVGNVAGRLLGGERNRTLAAQPGIVGHRMPRVREQVETLDGTRMLVLHSDGISEKWSIDSMPGALDHGPGVLVAAVLREAGVRRDDASVLAVRTAP
ncbi:SpoIIE family protein phosphatase [Nocardioides sp. CER19]|uniref:SpoIIE family protein phosphatase n=1 Tax=Nocardioides sp. CER19 TaxID=3038538 RepID=UPI002446C2B7|nr:SpoIIE family protein phosphatase [Nocardioides sp. CER19]MDH2414725.1 SpoIIE family protein phosphatase [Nocardioides sp. CER19]